MPLKQTFCLPVGLVHLLSWNEKMAEEYGGKQNTEHGSPKISVKHSPKPRDNFQKDILKIIPFLKEDLLLIR